MLNVQWDQIECELCCALLLLVLKDEFEVSGLILCTQCDAVICVS
jgi:hypothetical protein